MAKDAPSQGTVWDGFVNGPENALAQASVLALARGGDAAADLSPLVVHGPSGVGKSRLLAGLVAEFLARHSGAAVAHLGAESFAAACAEAAGQSGGWAELRERFRRLDLFVLEDLHALERARWPWANWCTRSMPLMKPGLP
jgi:chromosomal replication initiator protein